MTPPPGRAAAQPDGPTHPTPQLEPLPDFLERRQLEVLDVVPGAVPAGRRLLVGRSEKQRHVLSIAVADTGAASVVLDHEEAVLSGLRSRLDPDLARTVPRVVQRVQASPTSIGLVVTAPQDKEPVVPEPRRPMRGRQRKDAPVVLDAVGSWLDQLWQQTAEGEPAPAAVGAAGARWLVDLYPPISRTAVGLDDLLRAQRSMGSQVVRRTVVHGCLCPRHVRISQGRVMAVEDWGLGSLSSDPLIDLGGFAVRYAGNRLGDALAGRSTFGKAVRGFVSTGLDRVGVPPRMWRDLLMLAQLDRAYRAATRGDADPSLLISMLVRVLPEQRHGHGQGHGHQTGHGEETRTS
jgi:hypothetical protein